MRWGAALALWLAPLAGCGVSSVADPVAVMLDREADYTRRRTAARQAHRESADDPQYRAALQRIIWEPGYPAWQRIDAINVLCELDETALRRDVALRILLVPDQPTLDHIIDLAVQRRWADLTLPLVRSWSRPRRHVADGDRSERVALEALHPGRSAEAVLADVFLGRGFDVTLSHQVAAWDLLNRLDAAPHHLLQSIDSTDDDENAVLARTLQHAQRELGILPRNREEVLWLLHLCDERRQAFRREAVRVVATLNAEQRRGLALRHLPLLVHQRSVDEAWQAGRAAMVRAIESRISGLMIAAELDDRSRPLREWGERLTLLDLLAIGTLQEALADPQVVASLFRQADADLQDTSTEFGGVLALDEHGRWRAQMYRPLSFRGDHVYIPPQAMIEALYTSPFHYHFHAQRHGNARHAAPGPGDLALTQRLDFNFFVLTFIDRDQLNVDYFQRDGIVVDLGTIRRPPELHDE